MMLDPSPLVTVYVLNHNYAQYLEKCIESLLSQSYLNIELLIIDDGSTDRSAQVLKKYEHNTHVKVILQDNIGLIKSISKAFSMAKGKYVVRVDADDWVSRSFIDQLVNEIEKDKQIAMVFPNYYEVDENGHILHCVNRHDFSTEVTLLDQPAHGACTLIRRSAYLDVGGHNQKLQCQDGVDIWLALTKNYKVKNLKQSLFYYRKHRRSLTTNYNKILNNRAEIYRDHAFRRGYKSDQVVAFIPVREELICDEDFVLHKVGGKTLLDWTVDKALEAKEVKKIVISTDSSQVISYIEMMSQKLLDKPIEIHKRSKDLVAQGIHVDLSIRNYFGSCPWGDISFLVILTPKSPFSTALHVDTAIYSSYLFSTDVVDSVTEDNSILYYHNGHGLVEFKGGKIRHERDYVYVRKGGISVYGKNHINNLVNRSDPLENIVMGHVVIDEYSSFEVKNMNDFGVSDYIARNIIEGNL